MYLGRGGPEVSVSDQDWALRYILRRTRRLQRVLKRQRAVLGIVMGEVRRKMAPLDPGAPAVLRLQTILEPAEHLRSQKPKDTIKAFYFVRSLWAVIKAMSSRMTSMIDKMLVGWTLRTGVARHMGRFWRPVAA